MSRFFTLVSGSSGNAAYLSHNGTNILIDCGVSGKTAQQLLQEIGEDCSKIRAIVVTHEHSDHISGVGVLSRRYDIPVIASRGTWQGMNLGAIKPHNQICFEDYRPIAVGDVNITPFPIPHDANGPTGYKFDLGNKQVAVATDIGYITKEVMSATAGCQMVLLEANYDLAMLENGPYPPHLKARIKSKHGHLCNDDTARMARYLIENGTTRLLLGHLSKENNQPKLAFETVAKYLLQCGMQLGADVAMAVAPRHNPSPITEV